MSAEAGGRGGGPRGPTVVVVGLMGVGKSTLGRALASRLRVPHLDSDAQIEARFGVSGRTIAARDGVDRLHEIEAEVLLEQLADPRPKVISAASSVVEDVRCRAALAGDPLVCWLRLPTGALRERMASGPHRRRVSDAELEAIARRREPLFAEVADVELDASLPPEALVARVEEVLARAGQERPPATYHPG